MALAACAFAEVQDQESAEQYFRTYGYYPSWYNYGTYPYTGVRSVAYPYAYGSGYPYTYPAYGNTIYNSNSNYSNLN